LVDLRDQLLDAATTSIAKEVGNDKWYGFPPAYSAPQPQAKLFNCVPDSKEAGRFVCEVDEQTKTSDKGTSSEAPAKPQT
jgi:hypothetical protein